MVPILSMEDQPNGRVRVTVGTADYGQAIITVPREAMDGPGFQAVLDHVWNMHTTAFTLVRRTAKQTPR